ncbi:cilia- and flagella-associated protein 20-like [Aricia agestis]|uniref:cilia- and flagella-associated protein 20-like n=1 Tax=Aricia agestis TaxID=91739 RepID=UPI001C208F33|nr:cilia- and flagella-associated protein 20-like [Aricia agestis]
MFKNSYQRGLLSIFYSCGSNPLGLWDSEVQNGHIKRVTDSDVQSIVLEICSANVATTYISCPKGNRTLSIKLPFLVMIVKNLKKYFSFEICILDDKKMRRRFRISNFQSTTKIKPFCTTMPIGLSGGWNQIQFNLADFTKRAYGTSYMETLRVQVHANARLRRIYFCDRLYTEEELPEDYKLYTPIENKQRKSRPINKVPTAEERRSSIRKSSINPKVSVADADSVGPKLPGAQELTEALETMGNPEITGDLEITRDPELTEASEKGNEIKEAKEEIEALNLAPEIEVLMTHVYNSVGAEHPNKDGNSEDRSIQIE